ncbi:exocyst complex component Sec6-domain-containing protein [Lineolata rhizophorae]|uniref:Exocyst complex component Sec6-domain-containing protein n=1 Tax=Lineolata rhizophorae TaxID=578093 RepID=A0A6A6P8L2_9PEZI|nr:exocyst complex component Sec6-domain-containing protein [Lineolata rhizophorae]
MNGIEPATVKLAELLRHPEDLDKIAALKSEFQRKKGAVDSSLKLGLKEQLSITQAGMSSLNEGQRTVNAIKEEMMKIDKLCADSQSLIRDFPHVNLVAATHRNFEAVVNMKREIDTFEPRLARLEAMLREDDEDLQVQPNLLPIHYGLTQLRDMRDAAMEQVQREGEGGEATLQEYFNRLDDVVDWFDEHVGAACMNLIPLINSDNNGTVVRLALIIEEEEKNDKKVQALQNAQREYKELASRFKSIAAVPKELRGYKEKFLKAIELNATNQMEGTRQAFNEDPEKLDKAFKWYFNDLNAVRLGMVELMPKKWKIFKTYTDIYHKQMHDFLINQVDDPELPSVNLLTIINWVDKYYSKMAKLGVAEDELSPHVIDNRSGELVREYRQIIVRQVEEWMERMAGSDRSTFLIRAEGSLDTDENGAFRTKTMSDMWRMFRDNLSVVGASGRTDVAEGVAEAMVRAMRNRQQMWEGLVDAELQKYSQPNADQDGLQPLQDWLVAIANDQIACIDDGDEAEGGSLSYLSRFARDLRPLLSPTYAVTNDTQIESLRDGYVDLGTHCITVFVGLIFAVDFRAILTEFFTPIWYSRKGMGQIISTFEDYLADYAPMLHPSLRDILVEELADELLLRYLGSVRNKGAKIRRADPFVDKIKDDVLTVFAFFERFDAFFEIKQKWRAVDGFVRLLEADKAAVPAVFEQFKLDYWDVSVGWVEAVLRSRDDFDRSMLNAVKAKAAEVYVERGPETILSKVK